MHGIFTRTPEVCSPSVRSVTKGPTTDEGIGGEMSDTAPIGIIGGGMAGLMAAYHLTGRGRAVRIFEGRENLGGRAMTITKDGRPIELGAEFIQGSPKSTLELANKIGVPITRVRDQHFRYEGRRFRSMGNTWQRFARMFDRIEMESTAADYLKQRNFSADDAELFRLLIEGVHAAPLDDVSLCSMAAEAKVAAADTSQFRPSGGYGAMVQGLEQMLDPSLVQVDLETIVDEVHWQRDGRCLLKIRHDGVVKTAETERCLVTVPVGVLQSSSGKAAIRFFPDLASKSRPLSLLAMGHVEKLVLEFHGASWMRALPNADFVHVPEGPFPTFWREQSDATDKLTAWAGGPRAKQLVPFNLRDLVDQAVAELAKLCSVVPAEVRETLVSANHHDFSRDPFSLGAYPYAGPGGEGCRAELAAPIEDVLYFAGDATVTEYFGTVAGALESGTRAAREILAH